MPTPARPMANTTKINTVKRNGMPLYLDGIDFLHHAVADELERNRGPEHDLAYAVGKEKLDVIRIGVKHENRHRDRNAAQRGRGHAAVRADGADAPAQLEAFADDVSQLVQDLGQVTAGALLQ